MNYVECINNNYKSTWKYSFLVDLHHDLKGHWDIYASFDKCGGWKLEGMHLYSFRKLLVLMYQLWVLMMREIISCLLCFEEGLSSLIYFFLHFMLHCYSFKSIFGFYFSYNVLIVGRCIMHSLYYCWCLLYSIVSLTYFDYLCILIQLQYEILIFHSLKPWISCRAMEVFCYHHLEPLLRNCSCCYVGLLYAWIHVLIITELILLIFICTHHYV